jgi:hypothetical protein
MSTSSISFTAQLVPSDLHRAILWLILKGSWTIRIVFVAYAFFTALGLLSFYWSDAESRPNVIANFTPLIWLVGAWLVFMVVVPYFSARSSFRNQKGLHELTRYTISEDRIAMESATASHQIDWSHIGRAAETKAYFYLFSGKKLTYIIPKRAIAEGTTIIDLRKVLRQCVKGKVRILK